MSTKKISIFIQVFVVVTGVTLSSLSGWFLYRVEEKAIISEFQKDVNERAAALYREVLINLETLNSLTILFSADAVPGKKQFAHEAKKILSRYGDIKALEWIPRVSHEERAAYEERQRVDYPEFEITERKEQGHMISAEEREEYFPVYYLEPLIGNEAAFGFDLSSDATRLKALEVSRDGAIPQVTASITLVQESEKQKGFLAFLPVYKGMPTTLDRRRKNLKGFVLGVYRIGDIFTSSATHHELFGIEMNLVDETVLSEQDLLHVHRSRTGYTVDNGITYKKVLPEIWGRRWSLIASPTLSYISVRRDILPLVMFLSGIGATLFVAIYINIIVRRSYTIQRIVTEKTNALNEANKKLKKLSRIDGLTGIANRRFMDEFLDKEWLRAIRNGTPISFILIDIDFFKTYNDNYGHPEGDDCLKKVAANLRGMVSRSGDLVARYGGEEFALVLTETEDAEGVAENCRSAIMGLRIPHEYSEASDVVTISVGVCTTVPEKGTDPGSLIEAADKGLYKAKENGRNRVELVT